MAKQNETPALVAGRNIYIHNRKTIYHDRHTKQNYIIRPDKVRGYNYLSIRHFLAFAFGYTGAVLSGNIWIGLAIGIVLLAVLSYFFYKRYLPSLPVDTGFEVPEKVPYAESLAARLSAGRLLLASVVSVLLGVVLVFNAFVNEYETVILTLNCVLALAPIALGFVCLKAFFLKQKANKQ